MVGTSYTSAGTKYDVQLTAQGTHSNCVLATVGYKYCRYRSALRVLRLWCNDAACIKKQHYSATDSVKRVLRVASRRSSPRFADNPQVRNPLPCVVTSVILATIAGLLRHDTITARLLGNIVAGNLPLTYIMKVLHVDGTPRLCFLVTLQASQLASAAVSWMVVHQLRQQGEWCRELWQRAWSICGQASCRTR